MYYRVKVLVEADITKNCIPVLIITKNIQNCHKHHHNQRTPREGPSVDRYHDLEPIVTVIGEYLFYLVMVDIQINLQQFGVIKVTAPALHTIVNRLNLLSFDVQSLCCNTFFSL